MKRLFVSSMTNRRQLDLVYELPWLKKTSKPLKMPHFLERIFHPSTNFDTIFKQFYLKCTYVQRKCSSAVYRRRELHISTATRVRSAVDIQLFSKKLKGRVQTFLFTLSYKTRTNMSWPCTLLVSYVAFSFFLRIKHC